MTKHYRLYAHQIAVKGKDRSAIYDLHRGQLLPITNACFTLLELLKTQPVELIRQQYSEGSVDRMLTYLQDRSYGHQTTKPHLYPEMNLEWDCPVLIQSAVVAYETPAYDLRGVWKALDSVGCRYLELRWEADLPALHTALTQLKTSGLRMISVFLPYHQAGSREELKYLYEQHPKLDYLVVTGSPETWQEGKIGAIRASLEDLVPQKPKYIINTEYFLESQRYNPYYNRKVCIDTDGMIRNSLRQSQSFGHVESVELKKVVSGADFQKLWQASPDRIQELKDSELRYCHYWPYELEAEGAYWSTALFAESY